MMFRKVRMTGHGPWRSLEELSTAELRDVIDAKKAGAFTNVTGLPPEQTAEQAEILLLAHAHGAL